MAQQTTLKQELQNRASGNTPGTQVSTKVTPGGQLHDFLDKYKGQFAAALPKHLNVDRMIRLALTAFNANKALQNCDFNSVAGSIVMASQLGLEIGVAGQGYLVPYKGKCQFIPGWQGYVDLVSRSGRATVWTGAVYDGDFFDYALGDSPFVKHRPGGEDDPAKLIFVYSIGRVNGSEWPVIEVWPISRIQKHFKKNNKVGGAHYAHDNWEMYARKIPLLQVIKYMPKSIELTNALTAEAAYDTGHTYTMHGDTVVVDNDSQSGAGDETQQTGQQAGDAPRFTVQEIHDAIANAASKQALDEAVDLVSAIPKAEQKALYDLGKVVAGKFAE